MTWILYSLYKGRDGRKASEFSVATLTVDEEWKVVVECPNRDLFRKLRQHFASTIKVRFYIAHPPQVYAYGWKELEAGSEEHFREALDRLHNLDLIAVMVPE